MHDHLVLLAHFNAWVNRRLYESVGLLPDADRRRDQGAFFGSIHRTLNHLMVVDRLWTGRIAGCGAWTRFSTTISPN